MYGSPAPLSSGTIDDGGMLTVDHLAPGTYTSTEATKTGWDLTAISCDDSNSSSDIGTRTATFHLEPAEIVTCTFTNRSRATLTIIKNDDLGHPLDGAVFTLFVDNAPFDGPPPLGAEDTAAAKTCTTLGGDMRYHGHRSGPVLGGGDNGRARLRPRVRPERGTRGR